MKFAFQRLKVSEFLKILVGWRLLNETISVIKIDRFIQAKIFGERGDVCTYTKSY